ncbi:MAG: DUF1569 domain-containing protein [Bacteroidota bacterium]
MNHSDLFIPGTAEHYIERIQKLTPTTQGQWGKMNVAQMLAHAAVVMEKAMSKEKESRKLISYILGPLFKGMITNTKPYSPGSPTSPSFITTGQERDFETEKARLIKRIQEFSQGGPANVSPYAHPFFGKMSVNDWNMSQSKHLNHHLTQFGV